MSLQQPPVRSDFSDTRPSPALTRPARLPLERGGQHTFLSPADLLRPHSIGGVFDLAFDIYRVHFRPLFTLLAVLLLPMQAILYVLVNTWLKPLSTHLDAHSDDTGAALLLVTGGLFTGVPEAGIPGLLSLLVLGVVSAPVALAVADVYRGRVPVWTDCYRRAFARIPRALLGWTLMGFGFAAIVALALLLLFALAVAGAFVIRTGLSPNAAAFVGFIAVLTPYIAGMTLAAFYFSFTAPLIALEDTPVTLIPARTRQLTGRPRALRIWTAIVFLPIVFFTVQALMLLSLSGFLSLFTLWPTLRFCLETTLTVLLIAFLQPYLLVFLNVLYFDCRIQREGLDIHLLAARQEAGR